MLERTPNLAAGWTGTEGTVYFNFLHRFWKVDAGGEGKIINSAQSVEKAHQGGYRLRFWNIPTPEGRPIEEVWRQLLDAGVDLLSVDDVKAYRDFVVKAGPSGGD